jgi:hypothetical protein
MAARKEDGSQPEMLEDRITHHALLGLAAMLCGAGMLLITAGVYAGYCLELDGRTPLGLGGFGGLAIISGMWVGAYVKQRMRT